LESLAKTIQDGQLINPIYVYRYGNKCRLIAGERRTLASAIAGKKEIIARIAGQRPVGSKLKILQWIENNERMDLTLAERVASLEAILNAYFSEQSDAQASERLTSKLLSDLTGMSVTQSRRYLLILQGSADIKQAIAAGQLENIKLIELICGLDNAVVQQELLQAAVDGATFETVVRLKKQLENESKVKRVTRGRKKTAVSLGTVKPTVAKMIVEALVSANALAADVVRQIQTIKDSTPWQNSELVEKAFKKIIALLR
jgi:ParB family chromosome partitioning protein